MGALQQRALSVADVPPGADMQSPGDGELKESWSQFATRNRRGRRRIRTIDLASRVSYEYKTLKIFCKKRPTVRQWAVRDQFCKMDTGVIMMSPSMQSAFMRVFRLKDKGEVRAALRDIVPVLMYRNSFSQAPEKHFKPEEMIPKSAPETLNQMKRELYERKEKLDKYKKETTLRDEKAQARLRSTIRRKLVRFQKRVAVSNAIASRSVLYNERDAVGYMLFRGPAMYAALHRVFLELSKLMPHFVPRSMLDFGSGTGTAILVAKEVYDPGSLSLPLYRNFRQAHHPNDAAEDYQLEELRYDLKRLQSNNEEKKKARFLAVSALLENGEIDPSDLPRDLLQEIVTVAKAASHSAAQRARAEQQQRRHRNLMDGREWDADAPAELDGPTAAKEDDTPIPGEEEGVFGFSDRDVGADEEADAPNKTWWQSFVDAESSKASAAAKVKARLRPLQSITAVEPSPGMMETAMVVLSEEAQDVQWKRYLLPEDLADQHDLVVAAYTLSELASPQARLKAAQDLWRSTKGVLVLVEHANLHNFDMLMRVRDTILEEKGVGMWDWQPTIVGPCPHEMRCPLRYSAEAVKFKKSRVCSVDADYFATFIDLWARGEKFRVGYEKFCYLIIARNEMVPARAEARRVEIERMERKAKAARDRKQRDLYEASKNVKDTIFERLSEEAIGQPAGAGSPNSVPRIPGLFDDEQAQQLNAAAEGDALLPTTLPDGTAVTAAPGSSLDNALDLTSVVGEEGEGVDINMVSLTSRAPVEVPRYVRVSPGAVHKFVTPIRLTVPGHRFNRGFVDPAFQNTRPITPGEMLTIRREAKAITAYVHSNFPKYLRNVRYPIHRKKLIGTFCTPDGQLVSAKVYPHRFDSAKVQHSTARWKSIGGFNLLRVSRPGDLFPHNVPLYNMRVHEQLDTPNTLVDVKKSAVELAAMADGDPLDLDNLDTSEMNNVQFKTYLKLKEEKNSSDMARDYIDNISSAGGHDAEEAKKMTLKLDADAAASAIDWGNVVDAARRNVKAQLEKLRGTSGASVASTRKDRTARKINRSRMRKGRH